MYLCRKLPFLQQVCHFSQSNRRNTNIVKDRIQIALVGRTNVGKSTLFNRLTQSRSAIVHDVPGTTRDRRVKKGMLAGIEFDVLDTGGLASAPDGSLEEGMLLQSSKAVRDADLILFLIDGRIGITQVDKHFVKWLRRENPQGKVALVANKLEGYPQSFADVIYEFYELGMGQAIPISAEHGEGMNMLLDEIIPVAEQLEAKVAEQLKKAEQLEAEEASNTLVDDAEEDQKPIRLAIVGRPNVGKSTLLNEIIQDDRVLTGDMPGVTRDAVLVNWTFKDREIHLVDTAGLRRVGKRDNSNQIENLSARDTERAIGAAQVVIVVLDFSCKRVLKMDLAIAEKALDEGRAVLFAVNKSDLIDDAESGIEALGHVLRSSLAQVPGVPAISTSATTGEGIGNLMPEVLKLHKKWSMRISTGRLNRWLLAIKRHHPPPSIKGKSVKIKYMTQVHTKPPTFAVFSNRPNAISEAYQRFLINEIRDEFNLVGVPVRMHFRETKNPYYDKTTQTKLK